LNARKYKPDEKSKSAERKQSGKPHARRRNVNAEKRKIERRRKLNSKLPRRLKKGGSKRKLACRLYAIFPSLVQAVNDRFRKTKGVNI
jgi:hypothetical protein